MSDRSDAADTEEYKSDSGSSDRESRKSKKRQSKINKKKVTKRSKHISEDNSDIRIAQVVARIIQSYEHRADLCATISDLRSANIHPELPIELRDSTKSVSIADFGVYLHDKWFAIDNHNMFQAICDFAAEVFDLVQVSDVRYAGYRAYVTDSLTSPGAVMIAKLGKFVESQSSNSTEFQNVIARATRAEVPAPAEAARWAIIGVFGAMVINMRSGGTVLADAMLTRVREHAIIAANIKHLQTEISDTTRRLDQLTVSLDAIQKATAFPINNMEIG